MKQTKIIVPKTVTDFLVTREEFELKFDFEKQRYYTFPQPENVNDYYQSSDYISHTDSKKGFIPFLYQTVKRRMLAKKVIQITRLNKGVGSLLDIGAGTGAFLQAAKKRGWTVQGIEPNTNARKKAQAKGFQLKVSLDELSNQQFDVITLWHVLEHIPNLEKTITKIDTLLKPNGIVLVAVPNYKSFDAQFYQEFWAAYDVPRHLWHFSKISMSKLFSSGWMHIATQPMIFDSFYVSLLSEKYKTGKSNFIKAFYIGLLSNLKALSTKEYSSLIYCFKTQKSQNKAI